jgi:hypothetical protein
MEVVVQNWKIQRRMQVVGLKLLEKRDLSLWGSYSAEALFALAGND